MDNDAMERKLRDLYSSGDVQQLARHTIDYGDGTPVSIVSILETDAEGKITRPNPFEAPEWRRKWVEQMEPVATG